jgi:beta-galactosidase
MPSAPTSGYLYGTAYFRPPNPPRHEHRAHLTKIRDELNFDIIRVRMQWNAIHRRPDSFDWDEYDEIAAICDELGLQFFLETSLESAPYWLERRHPEARYVSANGQAMELGPYDSTQFGGYPGLCFHHAVVRQQGERFLRELAGHFRDHPMLLGFDCWNEPHLEPAWVCNYWGNMGDRLFCYCEETRDAFRRWLTGKYATVENLNVTWGRAYGEWDDVNPPNRHGTYADWLDWGRFWYDQLAEHMGWRYEILKSADPHHTVMSHSGAVPPFLPRPNAYIHNWKLAEPVDMWGTSYAPKYHNWDLSTCCGTIDATRSAARGKRFWISEMSGGSTYVRGFAKSPLPRPKDYRAWNWLSVAAGAKATIHWCYLEESTGPEATNFGLVRANGQITERAHAAAVVAGTLRRHANIIDGHQPRETLGILYDPDNTMQLFAMEGEDELYTRSHIGYYRAVWECDLHARYVTYDSLDDLVGLKVLVAPMCLTMPDAVTRRIAHFVRDGGVLIAEARTGLFDPRGYNRPILPAGELAEVVGAVEEEAIYSDPDNRPRLNNPGREAWPDAIYSGPSICFSAPIAATFGARGYLVPLQPTSSQVIGRPLTGRSDWDSLCLGVQNSYGLGVAYYFGTYVGLALAAGDGEAFKLITAIIGQHCPPEIRGVRLRPRLIRGDSGEALLAVFNDSRTQRLADTIALPGPYRAAFDIDRNEPAFLEGGAIRLEVDSEDVRVFRLSP